MRWILCSAVAFAANATSAQTFTKITTGAVVDTPGDSRSVNWVDLNNDGLLDLFISNGKAGGQNNMLYLNTDGTNFTPVTNDPIVLDNKPSDGATFADCDNDGDLDAFVVNWYNNQDNLFYTNNGSAVFTPIIGIPMTTTIGYSETAAWGDYDNDGLLDLYVTRSGPNIAGRRNQLYHNDGNNTFSKILTVAPVTDAFTSRSVNWTDLDNDGDLDLFVTNEGTTNNNENLYRNDGGGNFTKITDGPLVNNGGATMSSSWADYDNDGDLDVFLANDSAENALFRNDGNLVFTKITGDPVTTASHSFSSAWSDIDNDGDLDLFVTNAFNPVAAPLNNFLYLNNGNGTFTKEEDGAPATDLSWSYGCAFGDYNNDGFEDLAVATTTFGGVDANDLLYQNNTNDNHWITIKLVGNTTNKSAIGTKVRLTATINGVSVTQLREISAQSSYCGQNDLRVHFGLGDGAIVNSISVEWLSGDVDNFSDVGTDQFITISQGQGILKVGSVEKRNSDFIIYPNPASDLLYIKAKDKALIASVKIYDLSGKLEMDVKNSELAIDVSGLASGQYLVSIDSDNGVQKTTFTKE